VGVCGCCVQCAGGGGARYVAPPNPTGMNTVILADDTVTAACALREEEMDFTRSFPSSIHDNVVSDGYPTPLVVKAWG
jgi:hypothetical protein